ncbi:MAG: hypothetical protein C4326_05210 [Ignavibacteria bacterium]
MAQRASRNPPVVLNSTRITVKLHASPATKLRATFRYLSAASLLTAAAAARSQSLDSRPVAEVFGKPFSRLLDEIVTSTDSTTTQALTERLHSMLRAYGRAVVEDSTVYFVYFGTARRVGVPGDMNGWNPRADTMRRVAGTNFFYLSKQFPLAARLEYKLMVDSVWMLDPLNRQQAIGGYGPNSEVWMPLYRPPSGIEYRAHIPHGRLDSLSVKSRLLKRTHPVFVYVPPRDTARRQQISPVLYVNDGGEYIALALMTNVLDNLIADQRIPPLVVVFIDPRTDVRDASTSKRMTDYTMSDTYVRFLVEELRPLILRRYRVDHRSQQTGIMGASLGGLLATYAALVRSDVFGLCAAQSPSYWFKNNAIMTIAANTPLRDVKFWLDTGTIHDAQEATSIMRSLLQQKGYAVHYEEVPEGHHWGNWRARISHILEYFWGKE